MWFLARAFSSWNKCRNSLKKSWISIICYLFSLVNLLSMFWFISTANANAVLIAKAPSRETLTIQFQTIDFCALATLMIMTRMAVFSLCFDCIKVRNLRETVWRVCRSVVLVYKHVEKILIIVCAGYHGLDVRWIVKFFRFHSDVLMCGIWLFNVLIIGHIKESFHLNPSDQILL